MIVYIWPVLCSQSAMGAGFFIIYFFYHQKPTVNIMKEEKKTKVLVGEMFRLNNLIQTLRGITLGLTVTSIVILFYGDTTNDSPVISMIFYVHIIIYIICTSWIFISKKKMEVLEENESKSSLRRPFQFSVNIETRSIEVGHIYDYEQLVKWAHEQLLEDHWRKIQYELFGIRQRSVEIIEEDPYIKITVKRI